MSKPAKGECRFLILRRHVFKDEVKFALPLEGLPELHDVLLFESSEHLELPHGGSPHVVILCEGGRDYSYIQ